MSKTLFESTGVKCRGEDGFPKCERKMKDRREKTERSLKFSRDPWPAGRGRTRICDLAT